MQATITLTRRRWLSGAVASLGAAAFASAVSAKPGQSSANNLAAIKGRLPSTTKLIEEAAANGGAGQFYLSLEGKVIADVAWGKTTGGVAYTPATLVSWASAVKPATCVCLLKLWERGKLDLDDRVTKYIPEFGANDKEKVRIRHLLTHTAHLGGYAGPTNLPPTFEELVSKIIKAPREPYRVLERMPSCRHPASVLATTRRALSSLLKSAAACTGATSKRSSSKKCSSRAACPIRGAECRSNAIAPTRQKADLLLPTWTRKRRW